MIKIVGESTNSPVDLKQLVDLKRLKEEFHLKKTQKEVVDGTGIDKGTVSNHYNGKESVSFDALVKYSKFFGVSVDYLLGFSNTRARNMDVAKISEYTGLTPEAVEALHKKKTALDEYNAKTQAEQLRPWTDEEMTLSEELMLREKETRRDFFDFLNYIIETDARFLYTANVNPKLKNKEFNLSMLINGLKEFAADPRLIKTQAENAAIYYQRAKDVFRDSADLYQRLLFACSEDFKRAVDNYSKESRKEMTESRNRCQNAIFEFEKAKKGDETNGNSN